MGLPRTGHWALLYLALEFPTHDRKPRLPSGQSSVAGLPKCGAKPGKACDMLTDRMALIHIERLKATSRSKVK